MTQQKAKFKLGLIINPVAGLGGSVALKGSDGAETAKQAIELGAKAKSSERANLALQQFIAQVDQIEIFTVAGAMGQELLDQENIPYTLVYTPTDNETRPEDTEQAAMIMASMNLDLILFAGGDGTARNICRVLDEETMVLGIPAGCKIHSGVYAITPKAAGRIVQMLVSGELVSIQEADVMDIDEEQFRQGIVRAKRYGELLVPSELRYVQAVKAGGKESDELVLHDIAAHVIEEMQDDEVYIMGSGSTVEFIMQELGIENTLLGVDVIQDHQLLLADATAEQLVKMASENKVKLVITLIGGQGHILGRGNQQLSPELIKKVGKDNLVVVATKTKLQALNGRPIIVDTGDELLDKSLSGHIKVITGYRDQVLYPVGYEEL